MTALGLELAPASAELGEPIVDADHRVTVNGHFFWAASPEEHRALRTEPHRYTGPLLDPVDHAWFTPTAASPRIDGRDGILLFRDATTRDRFEEA